MVVLWDLLRQRTKVRFGFLHQSLCGLISFIEALRSQSMTAI